MNIDVETRTVVFSTGQRFAFKEFVCEAAECACEHVSLVFTEKGAGEDAVTNPLLFRLPLDVGKWELWDKATSFAESARPLADEFLRDLPDNAKKHFRELYDETKTWAKRGAAFRVSMEDIETGRMVSHAEVYSGNGSLLFGGRSAGFVFEKDGTKYFIDDLYCVNPDCDCRDALITFVRLEDHKRVVEVFDALISLGGRLEKLTPFECPRHQAREILRAWIESETDLLDKLESRYADIKDVGRANLERLFESRPPAALRSGTKIGRNDPCSCGSGKKYKKCCLGKG